MDTRGLHENIDPGGQPGADSAQLIVQQDRRDGADLLTLLTRRQRHRSTGAAAEIGAEFRVSQQLMANAELRWADLDADAVLLRGEDGLVGADPVSVGVSLGWRCR